MSGKNHDENGKFAKGNVCSVGGKGGEKNAKPPQDVHEIANALIEWSKKKDSCHIAEFGLLYDKTRTWIHNLAINHSEIKEALDLAREHIFIHHLKNGLENKWNQATTSRYISYYDKDLVAFENEHESKKRFIKDNELMELIINRNVLK